MITADVSGTPSTPSFNLLLLDLSSTYVMSCPFFLRHFKQTLGLLRGENFGGRWSSYLFQLSLIQK